MQGYACIIIIIMRILVLNQCFLGTITFICIFRPQTQEIDLVRVIDFYELGLKYEGLLFELRNNPFIPEHLILIYHLNLSIFRNVPHKHIPGISRTTLV